MLPVRTSAPLIVVLAGVACQSETAGADGQTGTGAGSSEGTSSPDVAATSSGSTGPAAECGDGRVDIGEHCDGEAFAGQDCPASCQFPEGTTLWTFTFDGGASNDRVVTMAFAEDGDIFLGGEQGGEEGVEALILRISQSGELIREIPWEAGSAVNSLAFESDELFAASNRYGNAVDVAAFDQTGSARSSTEFAGEVADTTTWGGSAVARPGAVVLFGRLSPGGVEPGFIATFDSASLDVVNDIRFGGPTYDAAMGLTGFGMLSGAFIDDDSVVLTGNVATVGQRSAWMQRRRLPNEVEWEILWDASSSVGLEYFTAPAVAPDGTIAVGWNAVWDEAEAADFWIGKFAPDGTLMWSDTYQGEPQRDDTASGVAVDAEANVFAIGTRSDDLDFEARDYDIVVLAYDSDGDRRWLDEFSGPGVTPGFGSWDNGGAIGVHPSGFVVACGQTLSPEQDYDVICRALAP